jgi:hypothetical protein
VASIIERIDLGGAGKVLHALIGLAVAFWLISTLRAGKVLLPSY